MTEREGGVVPVEDTYHSARFNDPRRFLDNRKRIVHVAHECVRYYDVKASVREVKATRIACPELDTICEAFLPGKTPSRFRQGGTEINADYSGRQNASDEQSPGWRPRSRSPYRLLSTLRRCA